MTITNIAETRRVCAKCGIRKQCPFRDFSNEALSDFGPSLHRQRLLHRGDKLYMIGDPFHCFYIVKSGSFKSSHYDRAGNLQIVGFHHSSDLLGSDGIQGHVHEYEVEALETSTVCPIPYPNVHLGNLPIGLLLLRQIVAEISVQVVQEASLLLVLGRLKTDQRLARFLVLLSEKMQDRGRSAMEFPLTMSRQDIANHLGITSETISRLFSRFEKQGLIKAKRRWIELLDKSKLCEIADLEEQSAAPSHRALVVTN